MISKNMVKEAFNRFILLAVDPNMQSGTVCQIGENWFYFGGMTAEEMDPEEYLRDVPEETIIDEIFEVLEDFRTDVLFEDEYAYYEAYLRENYIRDKNDPYPVQLNLSADEFELLGAKFPIGSQEELCAAISKCITGYCKTK